MMTLLLVLSVFQTCLGGHPGQQMTFDALLGRLIPTVPPARSENGVSDYHRTQGPVGFCHPACWAAKLALNSPILTSGVKMVTVATCKPL